MTTQRAEPYDGCTLPEAYREPIMSIQAAISRPPTTAEVLRPHRSASKNAGIVTIRMRSADIPEARKDAVLDFKPADWKRRGAYYSYQLASAELDVRGDIHKGRHQSRSTAAFPSERHPMPSASTLSC